MPSKVALEFCFFNKVALDESYFVYLLHVIIYGIIGIIVHHINKNKFGKIL